MLRHTSENLIEILLGGPQERKKFTYTVLNCVQFHQYQHLVLALGLLSQSQLSSVAAGD